MNISRRTLLAAAAGSIPLFSDVNRGIAAEPVSPEALDRVAAVMFRDIDDDPDREVIVLIAYTDEDPEAPPYFSNVALDWDAQQGRFVRLEQVEGEIEAFGTAGEVIAHLRQLSPP